MTVLRRKLFNRGGPVSSRGVGITSGLVPRYSHGGPVSEHTSVTDKFADNMEMLKGLNLYQPQTFDAKENMTPYLLDLSARLLGGTSKRGGIGGALEIGGQAMAGANPLLSQALQNKREFEATDQEAPLKQMALQMALEKDDPRFEYKEIGGKLYKIDTKGELPPELSIDIQEPAELRSDPKTVYGNFGENNTGYAQMFTYKDGKVEYRKDGQVFKKDQFSPLAEPADAGKAMTIQKSLPNNMVQDQISYDGGKTFTDFGAAYPRYKPEVTGKLKQVDQVYGTFGDSATPQYGQLFRYDDKVIYKVGGEEFENFTPTEKPKDQPTPIFQSKNIGEGMIQDEISTDNGLTFTTYGEAYPRFKADKEDQYNYSNTAEKTITKDGKKIKQTYAIYNKPGVTEPKKYLMFEEQVTDDPSVRRSGNVVITEGPSQGQRYGAVELKDGSVLFHDPMNPLANEQGLVPSTTYKGKFEYYGTTVTGDPESVFGGKNVEDIANAAAETANSLASGAALINDALSLGGNLDSLNRSILDKGGKILSQIPIIGDDAKAALFDAFNEDPQALQSFITNARIFVAQQIAAVTGEDSGRISEPERELTNEALALLKGVTDAESAIAAIQSSVGATYVQQHRNLLVVGGDNKPLSVYDPNGKNGFSEVGAVFHANRLATKFGFDKIQVQRTLKVMRDMEELGLQELTSISQDQQSHFQNNKNAINGQYARLIGGQE
jgi:hypothetical protein